MRRSTVMAATGTICAALGCAVWLAQPARAAEPPLPDKVVFNRDIRPFLSDTCFKCHGFDANTRKADLRLDTKEGAFAQRKDHIPIVPGDVKKSEAYQRLISKDPDELMPPPDSGLSLTPRQKALFKKWVEQGAEYQPHWSLIPPKRSALPEVKNKKWSRNAVDRFILAKLEQEGLPPAPEADKALLIRRLYLDLTGLPPTLAELDGALADNSPVWYESLADRLLDSPRYGERMAVEWLDASRYADTHGYHIDSGRDMWRWREWVIAAYNHNKPFDEFTVEQLAGDLLPNPTEEQQIATGFQRNHMINFEGGAIPEEYLTAYIVDRVNTTGMVWLGLSVGCAQCHDHKYDPISQKEFYQLYAFYHNVPENGLDGQAGNAAPVIKSPTAEQKRRSVALQATVKELETKLAALAAAAETAGFAQWQKDALAKLAEQPKLPGGAIAHYTLDETQGDTIADALGTQPAGKIIGTANRTAGKHAGALTLDGTNYVDLGPSLAFDRTDKFSYGAWFFPVTQEDGAILARMDYAQAVRGYDLYYGGGGKVFVHIISAWEGNAIRINTKKPLPVNQWHHAFVTYDGSSKAAGVKLYINGKLAEVDVTHDTLSDTIKVEKPAKLGERDNNARFKGSIDEVWFFNRDLAASEVTQVAGVDPIADILITPADQRKPEQVTTLRQHYLNNFDAGYKEANAALSQARAQLAELDKAIPTTMVMKELDKPRDTFMLMRGEYDKKGDKVLAATPAALGPLPEGAPANRLGLAQWLVKPDHPLTARVAVNRFWQKYFGVGIVKTVEDLGSQGEWPSHPELLDWLTTEFVRTGWDVRALQRLIVTSAAYRQSSKVTPELFERDPENRLLARGPRFRLSAEGVRDNALAISGLLHGSIGGPSASPYHPPGLWEEMAFGGNFSAQAYAQSKGKDLYRRTMYTFWKRTVPPAQLSAFDAPDRETCTVRRLRTNTPLQALVLMNDPTYVEASRKLAERMMNEAGTTPEEKLTLAFRLALARKPSVKELAVLRRIYDERLAAYTADPSAADQLLGVGESPRDAKLAPVELAAWAAVAGVILSLDETITKG